MAESKLMISRMMVITGILGPEEQSFVDGELERIGYRAGTIVPEAIWMMPHPRQIVECVELGLRLVAAGGEVIFSTNSDIALLAIQTAVARGQVAHELVSLNHIARDSGNRIVVHHGELDSAGRFGDWPSDIDDFRLEYLAKYLDASEERKSVESPQ